MLYPTAVAAAKTPATILVLGDSLSGSYGINASEGWVALLQQQLNSQGYDYTVINASVSGDTTRTGLSRIEPALKTHQTGNRHHRTRWKRWSAWIAVQ